MCAWHWALLLTTALLSWPLWTILHELSHIVAASFYSTLSEVKWYLYPHKDEEGNFFFARVQWSWAEPALSPIQWASIHSAPRLMNFVAALLVPLSFLFPEPWCYIWLVLWGASLVDLFVGSLGISEFTDLRRTCDVLNISPWTLRVTGMATVLVSSALGILLLFVI